MTPASETEAQHPAPATEPARDRRTVRALLVFTLIAGMIDAVTFLGLESVFAANMTGNLVLLGIGIAGAAEVSITGPALALGSFLLGAALIGRLEHSGRSRRYYATRLVRIELAIIGLAALAAIGFDPSDEPRRLLIIALLAGAMGIRNETVRRINLPELPTTVLTLTIAGFAAHEALGSRSPADRLRLAGIVAMVLGALFSALLVLHADVAWALLAIVAVEAVALLALGRSAADEGDRLSR